MGLVNSPLKRLGWTLAGVAGLPTAWMMAHEPHAKTLPRKAEVTQLPQAQQHQLRTWLEQPGELQERQYHEAVHFQALQDLLTLYRSPHTRMTLASFTDRYTPGADAGFGLHEVRMLDQGPLTITANIHWPLLPASGGFGLPDEIRLRARRLSSPVSRGEPGSEEAYYDARYRITWNDQDRPDLFLEPVYHPEGLMTRRVPVSVFSCLDCHQSGNGHALRYQAPGESLDHELIVQRSQYDKPLKASRGYRDVARYVARQVQVGGWTADQGRQLLSALESRKSFDLPHWESRLQEMIQRRERLTLGSDALLWGRLDAPYQRPLLSETGHYQNGAGQWLQEATEIEMRGQGKGIWWTDRVVIPSSRQPDTPR
jgi:hypothetical protein